jgi:hypothetical protein
MRSGAHLHFASALARRHGGELGERGHELGEEVVQRDQAEERTGAKIKLKRGLIGPLF